MAGRTSSRAATGKQVTRTPNPDADQLRKALWRRRRLRLGLCADCGQRKRLKGITRCAVCSLKKRRLNRRLRECKPWRKGATGAPPTYTDVQLKKLAKTEKVVAQPRKKAAKKKVAKKK
jgi:hypothetical protein